MKLKLLHEDKGMWLNNIEEGWGEAMALLCDYLVSERLQPVIPSDYHDIIKVNEPGKPGEVFVGADEEGTHIFVGFTTDPNEKWERFSVADPDSFVKIKERIKWGIDNWEPRKSAPYKSRFVL